MSRRALWWFALLLIALVMACGGKKSSGGADVLDGGADDPGGGHDGDNPGPMRDGGTKPMADGGLMPGPAMDAGVDASTPDDDAGVPAEKNAHVTSVAPTYVVAGEPYKYSPKSSEGGKAEWTIKAGPSGMVVQEDGATVAWEPTKEQGGKQTFTVETKAGGKSVTQTATVTVAVSQKQAEVKVSADKGGSAVVSAPTSKIQGAGVTVTKASVSSDKAVTVSELDVSPRMPAAVGDVRAVHFGPSGTVFSPPALVSLPLPKDVVLDRERLGAFVYDTKGRWLRVPVVRVDLENRLLYARAAHFSDYAAAQQALDLSLTLARAHEDSSCEGELVASAYLREQLGELSSEIINNASEELSALIEDGVNDLEALLNAQAFYGSLRFVRVLELVAAQDGAEQVLAQAVLATTLYAPGDGSATVTHADGLGNVLATFRFANLADEIRTIGMHLRGAATRARFEVDPSGALALRGRVHVTYFDEDASLDPVNVDELGVAAVDIGGMEPTEPALESVGADLDCDGLLNDFDASDDRFAPALQGEPREVASGVVGAPLTLSAWLTNAPANTAITFQVLVGDAELLPVEGRSNQRTFVAHEPGRFQVEARARVGSQDFAYLFVIDVTDAYSLPLCTPSVGAQGTLKVGEGVALTAVLSESRVPSAALRIEWGLMRSGVLTASPELNGMGVTVTLTPAEAGTYQVGCRVTDGTEYGTIGSTSLSVLEAQANRLPVDLALSPPSSTMETSETLTLRAWGTDPDGESLSFRWSSSGGTLTPETETASESTATFRATEPGHYDVFVRIADPSGIEQELTAKVLVIQSRAELEGVDQDQDGWPAALDCDDQNPAINPGARDLCGDDIDDDCSGAPRTSDCDFDGQTVEEGDCDDNDSARNSRASELCDGVDNDCDDATDEGFDVGTSCSAGVGRCANVGVFVCTPDGVNAACNAIAGSPQAEQCNGLDDDCDGEVDDGIAPVATSCGIGACAATGLRTCVQGQLVDSCVPGMAADSDATCNGIDDDCDSAVDEDFVGGETTCGVGACASIGQEVCIQGQRVDTCQPGNGAGNDATCDGIDDDCDGEVDEHYVDQAVSCGLGVCANQGVRTCINGEQVTQCEPLPGATFDTTCDGIDQDCDGVADDDFVALPEVCNGKDDDCDGLIDEGVVCGGGSNDDCTPSGDEVCNGLDDDCDGAFDENDVCELLLSPDSLTGVWWRCDDEDCIELDEGGLMFVPDGRIIGLFTFDGDPYDPQSGPYCIGNSVDEWSMDGDVLRVVTHGQDSPREFAGHVSIDGLVAVITWIEPPEPSQEFLRLRRVPEYPGGACPRGPVCQPEHCSNGYDDDCDGYVDAQDPDCLECLQNQMPEICDGIDNDCDGSIDELDGTCQADALGVCGIGQRVCVNGQEVCQPSQPDPAGEVCPDGLDNDCDGQVDEAGCVQLTLGETCVNPIDVSAGGVFHTELGSRHDVQAEGCYMGEYRDRVFLITVPPEQEAEYVIRATHESRSSVGGYLVEMPPQWTPNAGCPAVLPSPALCFSLYSGDEYRPQLYGGRSYLLVVESWNYDDEGDNALTLSVARVSNDECVPGDLDGDGSTICNGDCDDSDPSRYPGAPEQCNQRDDDCDGQVDELDGTCNTGLVGACATGVFVCDGANTICRPVHGSTVDYCGDQTDNDCNGLVDDNCVNAPGEACANAIPIGMGGTFSGSLLGARNDAITRCGPEGQSSGREVFYRFSVEEGGVVMRFRRANGSSVRYSLYRDCALEPVACDVYDWQTLEPGTYILAVEEEYDDGHGIPFSFTIGFETPRGGCLTPDIDGDGFTVCTGDCDESRSAVHPGASEGETCDQLDNDCNGIVDDLTASCTLMGQVGLCARGTLFCDTMTGEPYCQSSGEGDPFGREICGDQLDNDCDGQADEAGCTSVPAGDVCTTAPSLGDGGVFFHTLAGFDDDANTACNDGFGTGTIERFYTITLSETRRLRASATPLDEPTSRLPVALQTGCGREANRGCSYDLDEVLPPGTYILAVYGYGPIDYRLTVFSQLPDDDEGVTCIPGDLDFDGFTLCNGDCLEGDDRAYPGRFEECDGVDNDCDGVIDVLRTSEPCTVPGAVGACQQGMTACSDAAPTCRPLRMPGEYPELCENGEDDDCDGEADDRGTPGVDCVVATGESCALARPIPPQFFFNDTLEGASDDGTGCYFGNGGAEKYYRFDAPSAGYVYVSVLPQVTGAVLPDYTVALFGSDCEADYPLYCMQGEALNPFHVERAGPHYIVVESVEAFAYEVQIAFWDYQTCVPEDRDGDGQPICFGDCNDNDPSIYSGAIEYCDGIDTNCNGLVDDIEPLPCDTGLPGVCAFGHLACAGVGEPSCVPNTPPRSNDVCGDGLDNDCDGEVDESGCDALPPGETCGLAIDATGGGMFLGSLIDASDDADNCAGEGSPDRFYTFELTQPARLFAQLVQLNMTGQPPYLSLHLFQSCEAPASYGCGTSALTGYHLSPGVYTLAVEASQPIEYALFIAFEYGEGCTAEGTLGGDFDGDGVALCDNDCDEADLVVNPFVEEVCGNYRDDNCDGLIDGYTVHVACTTTSPGECAPGRLECPPTGAQPVCVSHVAPGNRTELCGDGLDNDCDGVSDEGQCVEPTGDTCELAYTLDLVSNGTVSGIITDDQDDAPGCGTQLFTEEIYRVTPANDGLLYAQAVPTVGNGARFTVLVTEGSCFGLGQCHYPEQALGQTVRAGVTYYLIVTGPLGVPFQLSWAMRPHGSELCFDGTSTSGDGDIDGDGVSLCDNDCNEADANVSPNAAEICGNGSDDDCDGVIDEACIPQ